MDTPAIVDVALALGALAFAVAAILVTPDGEPVDGAGAAVVLAAVACGALTGRRRFPVVVLVVVATARGIMAGGPGGEFALLPAVAVALYTVARGGQRRQAVIVATITALAMALVVAAADREESFAQELVGEVAVGLLPIAVADGARSRHERLELRIESEAEARVQAERLRIARDLHDVVAHGLSTIAVQSGVAAHLLESKPEQARESLDIINTTGKRSLEELRAMVGVLRSTDEAPLLPTPSDPDDLSAVVDGAARSGVEVQLTVHGRFPTDVADGAVVAVHRILQEALTNAARHGAGSATVDLAHGGGGVELVVANDVAGPGGPGKEGRSSPTGVGILGMTERALSLGGSLAAGPDDHGRFVVRASVPYGPRRGVDPSADQEDEG